MSRPLRPAVDSGTNAWDADVNDGFIQLYDRPLPALLFAGTLAELETARPAAQYEWCMAIVEYDANASSGNMLAFSDGTAWRLASNWQLLHRHKIRSITGGTTPTVDDDLIVVTGSGSPTVTLPAITAGNKGRRIRIKHKGTGTITVARTGSDTIDGATSFSIPDQYSSFEFVSDGTSDWMIF